MQFWQKSKRSQILLTQYLGIVDIAKNNGAGYILCAGDVLNQKTKAK